MRSFHCVVSRDPAQKKRRRWLDGRLELMPGGLLRGYNVDTKPELLIGTCMTKLASFPADYEFEFESGWTCQVGEEIRSVVCLDGVEEDVPVQRQHQPQPQPQRRRRTDQEILALFTS